MMHLDWKKCVLGEKSSILDVMRVMESSSLKIVLIVNERGMLLGTVTDGDIRRGFLKNAQVSDLALTVMNSQPHTARHTDSKELILKKIRDKLLHQIPVLDNQGVLVGLEVVEDFYAQEKNDHTVVIMAGGLGSRLKDLTKTTPKPLLRVGEKPIIETIIKQFLEYGFSDFIISLGYKGELIQEYCQNGSSWGCSIEYVTEDKPLGTAGALSLLTRKLVKPFIVINGDILTKVDFSALLSFHRQQNAIATMCVREFEQNIPYGVVQIDNHHIVSIQEKPTIKHLVSAGIYVLDSDCLSSIPHGQYLDMPTLFKSFIHSKHPTSAFPIHEYWIDIGERSEFLRADQEYSSFF